MKRAISGFLFVFLAFCVVGLSDKSDQDRLTDLEKRLQQVQSDIEITWKRIENKNLAYNRFNHDVVYKNKDASKIYKEIKELEKQIIEKRKQLSLLTSKMPEHENLIKERKIAYARWQSLKDSERLLRNEIQVLLSKVASSSK